jgi:Transposase and inactivated derivatives
MSERRFYSDELKAEAIKMIREQGLSQVEVSKKLSIPKGTIGNWAAGIGLGRVKANPGDQSIGELKAENAKLRKELAESRMERDILKKAAAYFAKESLHGTRS